MVIHQKHPLKLGNPEGIIIFPQQEPIDRLRSQHRHLRQELAIKFPFCRHGNRLQAGIGQTIQNMLHHHIAGQIPQLRNMAPLFCQMPQHTVQQYMEIRPVAGCTTGQIPLCQIMTGIIQGFPIGG